MTFSISHLSDVLSQEKIVVFEYIDSFLNEMECSGGAVNDFWFSALPIEVQNLFENGSTY